MLKFSATGDKLEQVIATQPQPKTPEQLASAARLDAMSERLHALDDTVDHNIYVINNLLLAENRRLGLQPYNKGLITENSSLSDVKAAVKLANKIADSWNDDDKADKVDTVGTKLLSHFIKKSKENILPADSVETVTKKVVALRM